MPGQDDDVSLDPEEVTVADILKGNGYKTALVGKWHLGHGSIEFGPKNHGFDHFYGFLPGCVDFYKHTYRTEPAWYIEKELIETRTIIISEAIDAKLAKSIYSKLLILEKDSSGKPITVIIENILGPVVAKGNSQQMKCSVEYVHTDYLRLAAHLRRRLQRRQLILIVTALPEQDEQHALVRAVRMLTPQHLPVVVVLSDADLKAAAHFLPAGKEELCRTLVARDVWTARRQTMEELRRRGALVVDTVPEDAGVDAVNAYLDVKRRQLL